MLNPIMGDCKIQYRTPVTRTLKLLQCKLNARAFVLSLMLPPPPTPNVRCAMVAPASFSGPLLTRIRGSITGKMGCASTALIFLLAISCDYKGSELEVTRGGKREWLARYRSPRYVIHVKRLAKNVNLLG